MDRREYRVTEMNKQNLINGINKLTADEFVDIIDFILSKIIDSAHAKNMEYITLDNLTELKHLVTNKYRITPEQMDKWLK